MEEWRIILAATDYEISSFGRVRRRVASYRDPAGLLMKSSPNKWGYLVIGLVVDGRRKMFRTHRLVALAFLGDPPTSSHEAAHNNGDKLDASLNNVAWKTKLENADDKRRHGTMAHGERQGLSKLTWDTVRYVRQSSARHSDLARELGVTPGTVIAARLGRTWRAA